MVSSVLNCLFRKCAVTAMGDVITVSQRLIQKKVVAVKMASVSDLYDVTWEGKEQMLLNCIGFEQSYFSA